MSKITTYEELVREKERLQLQLEVNKAAVRVHIEDLKQKLSPLKNILRFFSNFTAPPGQNTLLSSGLGLSLEVLIRRLFFAKTGFITRLVGPILLKNFSTNVLKNKTGFLRKIKSIFKSGKKVPA